MKISYDPKKIEGKWQKAWANAGVPKKTGKQGKFYILDMFPYPSGDGLHVGHVENFTATDIYARYKRYQGYDVLRPMGWDAFGLPAENFAIKTGIHPSKKTLQSIKNFKRQMQSVGLSYDWTREINASSPEYYRWTQWMFLFLYKNGLAYKKKAKVNWCESCHTVLANEQVIDGKCDRSGDIVIQKDLEQWFFKITDFIEPTKTKTDKKVSGLLSGLDKIDWPESTKAAQRHWIGRSEGAQVQFPIFNSQFSIEVFTTRLDTIYGCTYVVVAPEHPLVQNVESRMLNGDEVRKYIADTKKKTDLERTELNKDKTGICLEGVTVVHPFTGERLPVYVADYVLGTYGTGAVMGVPAHDERDFAFAKKYQLEIIATIVSKNKKEEIFTEDGILVDSGEFSGLTSAEAREKMAGWLKKEKLGKKVVNYRLRDWLISRQRYWGAPIPIVYCSACGVEEAKVKLSINFSDQKTWKSILAGEKTVETRVLNPEEKHRYFGDVKEGDHIAIFNKKTKEKRIVSVKKTYAFRSVAGLFSNKYIAEKVWPWKKNATLKDWEEGYRKTAPGYMERIEKNGLVAWEIEVLNTEKAYPVSDTDLPVKLPTDVDFRPTGESPLVRSKSFHKVKCPKCGGKARRESDTMDTFVCSSWYYMRFADPENTKAFASKKALAKYLPVDFYMGGAEHTVLHLLYARFFTKALMKQGHVNFDEPFQKLRHQGMILAPDGQKMSKSKGNVINPDQMVAEFGADSLRLYEMFMGPLEDKKAWNTGSIIGVRRFLEKVWKLQDRISSDVSHSTDKSLESLLHRTIRKVTEDIEEFKFNTAISSLMILVNELEKADRISLITYQTSLILLSPFAPHMTEELWSRLGEKKSIFLVAWPKYDKKKIVAESVNIAVQVNGKVRAVIAVVNGTSEDDVKAQALADENVKSHIGDMTVKKVIYIPGKIVSIVIG